MSTQAGARPGIDVRGDGGMIVVAPSQHHSGVQYRWMSGRSPLEIATLPFPEQWAFFLGESSMSPMSTHEHPDHPRLPKSTNDDPWQSGGLAGASLNSDEEWRNRVHGIIQRTLPLAKGTRHDALFGLTRELVGLFGADGLTTHFTSVKHIVNLWYATALEQNLSTGTHDVDECAERVVESWDKVKVPGGWSRLEVAARKAHQSEPHSACKRLLVCSDLTRTLIGMCAILANNDGRFFLSCGYAAKVLSKTLDHSYNKREIHRKLNTLIAHDILRVETKGEATVGGKATSYRFLSERE